jgi:hypothetical protein
VFFASHSFKKVNVETTVLTNAVLPVLALMVLASLFANSLTLLVVPQNGTR